MPTIPLTVPRSIDGHTYQSSKVPAHYLFNPDYIDAAGRLTVVGTWGNRPNHEASERRGLVYRVHDWPCPYCSGPLYALVAWADPLMFVARCIQQRDHPNGDIECVLERMPATHEQLGCDACGQFFSAPKAR